MASSLDNNATIRTSSVDNVGTIHTNTSLNTMVIDEITPEFDLPQTASDSVDSSTLDFNMFLDNTETPISTNASSTNPISETNPSKISQDGYGIGDGNIESTHMPSFEIPNKGNTNSTSLIEFNNPSFSPIHTRQTSNNGLRENQNRNTYHSTISYEAPIEITNNNTSPLTLSEGDLLSFVQNMSPEEYDSFIESIEKYYDNQKKLYEQMLYGYNGQKGYTDYLDWINNYLKENPQLNHIYEQILNNYNADKNALLNQYNNFYSKDLFEKQFQKVNISYQQFLRMNKEEQWQFLLAQKDPNAEKTEQYKDNYTKRIDEQIKREFSSIGISSYQQLIQTKEDLKVNIERLKQSIELTKNLKKSAKYDYLPYLKNYKINEELRERENKKLEDYIKKNVKPASDGAIYIDYYQLNKTFSYVTPLDYLKAVKKIYPEINESMIMMNGPLDTSKLLMLEKVSEVCPDYASKFHYLFQKNPKLANQYLKDCEYQLNNVYGQLKAQEFLSTLNELKGDHAVLEAVANTLGVSTEGLIDGLQGFGEGAYYSIESLLTALGLLEENRTPSSEEFKKMFILQALLPKKAQLEAGLIKKLENGKYENNPATNPLEIIDYSKSYSGFWLNHNYSVSQGIGNMLPSILLNTVCPGVGMWALGISAGGNAYHQSMVDGKNYFNSVLYGLLTGASESITEKLLGGLPGLSNVQVTSLSSYLQAVGGEGFQESFQGVLDYVLQAMVLGENLPDIRDSEGWDNLLKDIGMQGLYGAITAGILQTPSLVRSLYNNQQINHFMDANGITLEEQQAAMQELRNRNPEYFNLSDSEIKLLLGKELATIALINKAAAEYNVSKEVANIMLALNVDTTVAQFMLENNIDSLESLNSFRREQPLDDNEINRDFIKRYLTDSTIEVPLDINPELVEFLEKYKTNQNYTQSNIPESLSSYATYYSEVLFFGGEENYQKFRDGVENYKKQIAKDLAEAGLKNDYIFHNLMLPAKESPEYVCAYLEYVLDQYSNWQENNLLQEKTNNTLVFDNLETTINTATEYYNMFPPTMANRFNQQLADIKESFINNRRDAFINLLKEKNLDATISENGMIQINGLLANSVYEFSYVSVDSNFNDLDCYFIIETDENGVGTPPGLTPDKLFDSLFKNDIAFEYAKELKLMYNGYNISAESAEYQGYVNNSPYYPILNAEEGTEFGVNQAAFKLFDFEKVEEYNSMKNPLKFFTSLLNGSIKINLERYFQMQKIVKQYLPNLSDADTVAFLKKLDSIGACSHTATINQFILQASKDPEFFRQVFGYDLYRKNSSGEMVLNGDLLLADYYTYLNKDNSNFFEFDGEKTIYKDPPNHIDQEFSTKEGFEEFLNWKLQHSAFADQEAYVQSSTISSSYQNGPILSNNDIYHEVYEGIHNQGKSYELSFYVDYDKYQQLIMYKYNPKTGLCDIKFTTDDWFQDASDYESGLSNTHGAGHATTVVDASPEGLYIQSWGALYYVPYETLQNTKYIITDFQTSHQATVEL